MPWIDLVYNFDTLDCNYINNYNFQNIWLMFLDFFSEGIDHRENEPAGLRLTQFLHYVCDVVIENIVYISLTTRYIAWFLIFMT